MDANVWISDKQGNITPLNYIDGLGLGSGKRSIYDLIKNLEIFEIDWTPVSKDILPLFQSIKGKKTRWEEGVIDEKTGKLKYREHRSSPIKDKDGNVSGVVGLTYDITDRKEMEKSLIESRKKGLELIKKLKEADESKTSFLSSLSHELRNPLATIMMGLDLLQGTEENKEIQEKTIEMMVRQGKQLSRLVDDLLDMTRITQNRFELKLEDVEINRLLSNIVKDSWSDFDKNQIGQDINISKKPIYIKGDPIRLTQAIENLLHNASKFTPKYGKISISLKEDYRRSQVVISIKDNGEGIGPELIENIFQPFVQVKNGLGKSSAGLGIGLSIVKDIIERHNGTIEALSRGRGWGTEFIIRLPII